MKLLAVAGLCALSIGVAPARAVEAAAPSADEIRLTIKMGERSVSFLSKQEPLVRKTMTFEVTDHAPTDEMRAAVAELLPALQAASKERAFVVTAYAADPTVAYRRARAVRGELIERHQIGADRLLAAGRAAPGHVGGATVVDIHEIDPAACAGCGATPFRTIAYDSGTTRLVTMLPERLASAGAPAAQNPALLPAKPVATVRRDAPKGAPVGQPPRDIYPMRVPVIGTAGGCPRPRIIIDDYYPGGPIIPCRPSQRSGRG